MRKTWEQFGKYLVGGGVYFWTGYATFAIFYSGFGRGVALSKVAADTVGLSLNFLVQRWWAFRKGRGPQNVRHSGPRYTALVVIDLIIDYGIVLGLASAGVTPYAGQFISAGFMTGWNWLWYKYWVFKK
jgi:putative flippase GtrA